MPQQLFRAISASLAGLVFLSGMLACRTSPSANTNAPSTLQAPATYTVAGVRLSSPVKITVADYFTDGGSMMLKFRDADARELIVVHYTPLEDGTLAEQKRNGEPYRFYVGGFPRDRTVVKLQQGGDDERELLRLVEDYIRYSEETGGPLTQPDVSSESYGSAWDDYRDRNVRGFRARLAHEVQGAGSNRRKSVPPRPN